MANSRLEKIGTIYTRAKGLVEAGAVSWVDRPLWFDVYEAFPPKEEPRFDRPADVKPLKKIFYEEDKIRAAFHNHNKHVGIVNLNNQKTKSLTQQFIDVYKKLDSQYDGNTDTEKIYFEAIETLKKERENRREGEEYQTLSAAFSEAQNRKKKMQEKQTKVTVNIKEILKE